MEVVPRLHARVLRCAGDSDPGLARDHNEDRLHVDPERGILIVVDGLGGEAGGETAAETALIFLRRRLERQTGSVEQRIREAITVANNEIVELSERNPAWAGMGCVLTVAVVENGSVTVGHVGDSRLYKLHAGGMDKVTHDHSPVGVREDQGELSEHDAMHHPRRSEVYRSVGTEPHTPGDEGFIEIVTLPLEAESALLLCSDGLSDLVPKAEIERIVRAHAADERKVVRQLIAAANAAGGRDNVTVIFAAGERFAASSPAGDPASAAATRALPAASQGGRAAYVLLGAAGAALLYALFTLLEPRWRPVATGELAPVTVPPTAGPRILRVGTGGDFTTIGEALGAARAGDTVLVAPGIYREQVRLEEGVTLASAAPREAVLEPASEGAAPVVALVAEGLSGGTIVGFRISGAAAPLELGIVIKDAAVTVDDVEVSGARIAGVEIEGKRAPTLRASYIHDNLGAGIAVRSPVPARIAHNLVTGNGRARGAPGPGIDLAAGAQAVLRGNVIAGNAAEGVRGVPADQREAVLTQNVFVGPDGRRNAGGPLGPATAAPGRR